MSQTYICLLLPSVKICAYLWPNQYDRTEHRGYINVYIVYKNVWLGGRWRRWQWWFALRQKGMRDSLITEEKMFICVNCSDVDPHWSYADPDPQNLINADPDRGQ